MMLDLRSSRCLARMSRGFKSTRESPVLSAESKMKITFQDIGWKSKVAQKRATFSISINKLIIIGNCIQKGQTLFSYLAKDKNNRSIIITYLDGKEK